jgi:transcriptional regulator with XRE-family HTH domain
MNFNRLRGHMMMHGESQSVLAEALGLDKSTMSLKMTGKYEFKRDEIQFIAFRYGLSDTEIRRTFFPTAEEVKVDEKDFGRGCSEANGREPAVR